MAAIAKAVHDTLATWGAQRQGTIFLVWAAVSSGCS